MGRGKSPALMLMLLGMVFAASAQTRPATTKTPTTTKTIFDIDGMDDPPVKPDEAAKPNGINNGAAPEADAIAKSVAEHYPDQLKDPKDVECVQFHDAVELRRNAGTPAPIADSYSRTPVSGTAAQIMLWGLYEDWPPGKYLIVFRVQAMSDLEGEKVCGLQVASGGKNMARHLPSAQEFQKGQWSNMPVILTLKRTRTLEYRVWPQKNTIGLDRIYVFRFRE